MTPMRGMNRWADKTAVVTGAGSAVGAGVAAALAGEGMRVVALDSKEEEAITEALNKLKYTSDVTARQCDVSDLSQLTHTFRWLDQHHGGVHVLVSLTGLVEPSQITGFVFDTPGEEASESQGTDVETDPVLLCARHAVVSMVRNEIDGHIINVNSKGAGCTETLNQELARLKNNKIKVTSISPGSVSSKLPASTADDVVTDSDPSPVLEPADIAHAVLFALSTSPHANVHELNIASVAERRL
uniref:Uncharacterized protein n=1 Tax=Picea sitchensis TaxID=3332 RepID=A9NM30_PICSI|nr:unknown [Picea sitchensis]